MNEIHKTWSVIEVGDNLQLSNGSRSFKVMKVEDHDEIMDKIIDSTVESIKLWRDRAEFFGWIEKQELVSPDSR